MLKALADEVIDNVRERYRLRARIEGAPQDGWLLVDYGDVVVQIFSPDRRNYYRLEDLWAKGKVLLRLK
jgi:ribosome-associated protein